jgi:hypothetical protein
MNFKAAFKTFNYRSITALIITPTQSCVFLATSLEKMFPDTQNTWVFHCVESSKRNYHIALQSVLSKSWDILTGLTFRCTTFNCSCETEPPEKLYHSDDDLTQVIHKHPCLLFSILYHSFLEPSIRDDFWDIQPRRETLESTDLCALV